jgi:phytoene synthase
MDVYAHCAALVRERDRDRWLADLFAPEPARKHLFALHAFDAEVSLFREIVGQPLAAEIRIQWWRDVITGAGEGAGHPVAEALLSTIAACRLPPRSFERLLEARIFDHYDDPMPTMGDLEGYLGDTVSAVFQLGAIVMAGGEDPGSAEVAGHAGVALGLARLIGSLPVNARLGQHFLPTEVLDRHDVRDVQNGGAPLAAAIGELRAAARRHLALALVALTELPPAIGPAFLPLAVVEPDLRRQEKRADPLAPAPPLPAWRRQWAIWRMARRLR